MKGTNRKKYGREERWIGKIRIILTMSRNKGKVKMVTYINDHKFLFEHSSIVEIAFKLQTLAEVIGKVYLASY
jgi:hypothetical protein